jgi:hypothetical protein
MFNLNQFIVVQFVPKPNGKADKLPIDYRTKRIINPLDPQYWTTHGQAKATAAALGEGFGIGFVFTTEDPYFFIDVDGCVVDGQWSPESVNLMKTFSGAYMEVSHSRKGFHIIGRYDGEFPKHKCRSGNIELYHSHRFVALTGVGAKGNPDCGARNAAYALITDLFSVNESRIASVEHAEHDDNVILQKMLSAKPSAAAAFGSKATIQQLWNADIDALQEAFPAPGRDCGYDRSSADAALAQHLAFWTNNNESQINRLMRLSGLNRDKYERGDYLPRTIGGACAKQKTGYQPRATCSTAMECDISSTQSTLDTSEPASNTRVGSVFLDGPSQQQFFEGCVYVADENKILVPGGVLYNQATFNAKLGGPQFVLTQENSKTTNKAWDAFTLSAILSFPKVDSTCFRPDLKPATLVKNQGQTLVNIYWPVAVNRKHGNVTPLLEHVAKMLPDPEDQRYLLGYFAALVQFPGYKFSWCPIIQGVQGNGKTFLSLVLTNAIGDRYCHTPKATDITAKFNSWIYGRILICVEDFHISGSASVVDTMEILKPMITGTRLEIEAKGMDKVTREICANFIINTNHKSSLRITKDDRRYAVFFTAQQEADDLIRDGMDADYFKQLFAVDQAAIAEFFHTYVIEDKYNPLKMSRAPRTSTTAEAVSASRSNLEYSLEDAIESQEVGFRGGWISSTMLNRWLKANDHRLPLTRFGHVLKQLGYESHPHLINGRTSRVVTPDGMQSKLYIRTLHPQIMLSDASAIATAYENAQKNTPPPV